MQILVVEDDKLNQKIVNYILQKKGATVEMACDGMGAIELLLQRKFDLILMDLQMPGMDGYTTAKYIREHIDTEVLIIALTADPFADKSVDYVGSGINACISKPIDANILSNLISGMIVEK